MPTRRELLRASALGTAALAGTGAAAALLRGDDPGGPLGAPAELRLATGPPGAVYREIGAGVADVLTGRLPRTRVRLIETGATVDNLALLADGGTDLAFASLDATCAGMAVGRPADTTAVTRLYENWLQLLVLDGSPADVLADLDGFPVAAGSAGSGTRFTTERLLELTGVRPRLVTANQEAGAAALVAGEVAAMFTLSGVPTPAVARRARTARLRMIPLGGYVDELVRRHGGLYSYAVLPATAYNAVSATDTLTTPNLLLAQPTLSADVVAVVADALFAERARIALGHPEANRLNVRTGIATSPVRLHPGAVRYFRSIKG